MKFNRWLTSSFATACAMTVLAACDTVTEQDLRSSSAEIKTYDAEGKQIVECNGKMIRLYEDHDACDPQFASGTPSDSQSGSSASSTTTTILATTTTLPGNTTTTTTIPGATTTTTMASVPAALRSSGVTRGLLKQSASSPTVWIFEMPATMVVNNVAQPWNTAATKFELKAGDTLRVYNRATTSNHTIHTNGSPCPHGGSRRFTEANPVSPAFGATAGIPIGGWLECDIPANATQGDIPTRVNGQGGQVYDHNTNAAIHISIIQ